MSINDTQRINIRIFLEQQRQERYRAFVIHGSPLKGKTTFAHNLAKMIPGGVYLDMLKYVIDRPELTQQVDILDTARLCDIILTHAKETSAKLLLVDEIDFLVHIWGSDLTEFKHMVKSLSKSLTPTIVGFFLQTQSDLEEWVLLGQAQQNRILQIEDIASL